MDLQHVNACNSRLTKTLSFCGNMTSRRTGDDTQGRQVGKQ